MADTEPVAVMEAGQSERCLRVEFFRAGELLTHTISLIKSGQKLRFATSSEGVGEGIPHLVPVFTDLVPQEDALMLTGASGPCHWSMSVQVGDARSAQDVRWLQLIPDFSLEDFFGKHTPLGGKGEAIHRFLFFDVACRIKESVAQIGSRYQLDKDFDQQMLFHDEAGLSATSTHAGGSAVMIGANPSYQKVKFSVNPSCQVLQGSSQDLSIFSIDSMPHTFPTTLQWSYAIWGI